MTLQIPLITTIQKAFKKQPSASGSGTTGLPTYREAGKDQLVLTGPKADPNYRDWLKTQRLEWEKAFRSGKTTLAFDRWLRENEAIKDFERNLMQSLESALGSSR